MTRDKTNFVASNSSIKTSVRYLNTNEAQKKEVT